MKHLGITGRRDTPTGLQCGIIKRYIDRCAALHHGDCLGADALAAGLALEAGKYVVAYPGTTGQWRANTPAHVIHPVPLTRHPELTRNHAIVDACDMLLAVPRGPEHRRSGTWATVRYARRSGKPIVIIWPDGTVTEE
jgi:hypothetical protein